ncbi:hypothetical protein JXA70_04395 [candidate division KSB1 bacterium]|nr:hypothetical protein [candidate division KSB1 bacterium]
MNIDSPATMADIWIKTIDSIAKANLPNSTIANLTKPAAIIMNGFPRTVIKNWYQRASAFIVNVGTTGSSNKKMKSILWRQLPAKPIFR